MTHCELNDGQIADNFQFDMQRRLYQNPRTNEELFILNERQNEGETLYVVLPVNIPSRIVYRSTKRIFDLSVSLVSLIVLAIPMLIIAILIRCDSKGPIIYRQERLGLHGKRFTLYKFRSMCIDAEKYGARWASAHDDRVTNIGSYLRGHRLDELPQLINIVLGQMSIVGPRPERKIFYDEFEHYIKGFSQRMKVLPGLTGLAQINGGYALKPEEKIKFDVKYMKERSFWLDLRIIFKTAMIVCNKSGAR